MPEIEDMDLIEVSSEDEAGAPKGAEQPAAETSSASTDVSNTVESDALDIVRDVVAEREPTTASSASEEVPGKEAGEELSKGQDNENFSDVPFNKHPRFQQVLGQLKSAKVDAERYQNVERFLEVNGLEGGEAAELLTIGGLIKTNPAEAWARMKPTVEAVLRAAGEILPPDLQAMVQNGQMDAAAAMEVSRSRAQVQSVGVQRDFEQQRAERLRLTDQAKSVSSAADNWEADRRRADPNFDAKLPAITEEVKRLQSHGWRPNTPEGVQAVLAKAYETVNATLPKPAAPISRARPVTPIRGGQSAGTAAPKPTTTLGIIQDVVARRQG